MKTPKYILVLLAWMLSIHSIYAHPSWGIVVDKDRNIYFADITHKGMGGVWKLTNDGKLELLLENFHAHNVSLDEHGNLVTAHGENNHTMVRINKDETVDTLYHCFDHKEFFGGNCTYSPLGEIVFGVEKYLWRLNKDGQKEKLSDHRFEWNQTVYADESGNYYGPDIGDSTGKLIKIDSMGKAHVIATNLISKLDRPYDRHGDILMGITEGCDGHLYIAELAGKRIIKVLDNQETETFYTSNGDWFPTGIDFFSGDAYILEYKTKNGNEGPRIIKIDEAGNKTEVFNYDRYDPETSPPLKVPPNDTNNRWIVYTIIGITIIALITGFILLRKFRKQKPRDCTASTLTTYE